MVTDECQNKQKLETQQNYSQDPIYNYSQDICTRHSVIVNIWLLAFRLSDVQRFIRPYHGISPTI